MTPLDNGSGTWPARVREWLSRRWSLVIVGLVLVSVTQCEGFWPFATNWAAMRPSQIAESVVDQDLKQLSGSKRKHVLDALRTLAGTEDHWRKERDSSPHRLLRWPMGETKWVLVATHDVFAVPEFSWMAVHQFDAEWRQIAVVRFDTGYRMAIRDVRQQAVEDLPEPAIVVRLRGVSPLLGYGGQVQYYTLVQSRVVLVRIEDEDGRIESGNFNSRLPWTGPVPPTRSTDAWIASLASANPADVLETLTWLTGRHLPSNKPRSAGVDEESVEDSRLFESVRDDPRTRQRLAEVASSSNAWIREAVALALPR